MRLLRRFRGLPVAILALALSAGLVLGAQPGAGSLGLPNAASHSGKIVPVGAPGEQAGQGDENDGADEDAGAGSEDGASGAGDSAANNANCSTDPTGLTDAQLAALRHGSIVCWAAHQTSWPSEFANKGAWVSHWAHTGKGSNTSASAKSKAHGKGD